MSDSNRGKLHSLVTALFFVILVGMLVMLTYDSGRKHGEAIGEYAANTDTYARHTQEQIEQCLTLPEDGTKSECMVGVIEASNEHERAEKDLIAQTEMALWALGMLVVSTLMMLVSALGVWWIKDTLIETRKAVKAANDGVIVAREIGQRQIRPYAFCSKIEWERGKSRSHRVRLTVKNAGNAPAEKVEINYTFVKIASSVRIDPEVPLGGANMIGHVFPQSTVSTISPTSAYASIHEPKQTRSRIEGYVRYWDPIFKKTRTANFLFIASAPDGEFIAHADYSSKRS